MQKAVEGALELYEPPEKNSYTKNTKIIHSEPRPSLNILIAEDNKTNQLVLKTMLKVINPHLVIAQNGCEAVAKFAEKQPDLILMDMSMPEMDGLCRASTTLSGSDNHVVRF